jgi:HK97 family phage portal protein
MPTLVGPGDRLISREGRATWMRRGSVPFSSWAGGGAIRLSGEGRSVSYHSIYRAQPWVGISINKLARQISRLPLKVYEIDSQGDHVRVREGSLVERLKNPYPRCSPAQFKQKISFPMLLHGNAVIAKDRPNRGAPPANLVPLDWRYVSPDFEDGRPVDFWTLERSGNRMFFAPEEVVHFAWEAGDSDLGISPLEQLGVTLRLEDSAQRYGASSFTNAARPSGALIAPAEANIDPEERQELREELRQTQQGEDNAFNLLFLTGGLDFKAFSHTAVEAALIEQRKLNREEVAAVYDIPPPLIGILDHATYSNVAEMHRMLYMTVLGPWLTLIEETLQAQLIDPEPAWEGLHVEFDLSEVLKGDTKERIDALKTGISTGLYTINEARKIENLPRIDNAVCDEPLIPVNNMQPVGATPDIPAPGQEPMLASLERARDRVVSKALAGELDPTDPDLGRLRAAANGTH